jgi:coenzyme F420-reducing hydrogenase gamma subunit
MTVSKTFLENGKFSLMVQKRKPKLAVWKFASCDGCQLTVLNCEDELLTLTDNVELAYFLEASSATQKGPYDISIAEGSVTTQQDVNRIHKIRKESKLLIAAGACASAGGIQALRNFVNVKDFISTTYPSPEYVDTLDKSTPFSHHVHVDYELEGCPINKHQLLDVITGFLHGRRPNSTSYSVCIECKRRGNVCVMVAHGVPCMGPVTRAGCNALCPTYNRGCYSCYGPKETPNTASLSNWFRHLGMKEEDIVRIFRTYYGNAEPFRKESEAHEK